MAPILKKKVKSGGLKEALIPISFTQDPHKNRRISLKWASSPLSLSFLFVKVHSRE